MHILLPDNGFLGYNTLNSGSFPKTWMHKMELFWKHTEMYEGPSRNSLINWKQL